MSTSMNRKETYITFCPKCKSASLEPRRVCDVCSNSVIETCITVAQFDKYVRNDKENKHAYVGSSMYILNISESYTTPLDEIVAGMRNAKLLAHVG